MKILFLLIAYNNDQEVMGFISQLGALSQDSRHELSVCVTDNVGNFDETLLQNVEIPCTVLKPGRNLGYLNGCGYALDDYLSNNSLPDWVSVSNTDLQLPDNYLSILDDVPESTGQLSPRVVKDNGVNQNPHIFVRPGNRYYLKMRSIHFNSFIGGFYIWLSGKARAKSEKIKSHLDSNDFKEDVIYCAHGSIFFLAKEFFQRGGDIENGPFLYGEEIYIGEQLFEHSLTSLCRPSITVKHYAHATSKLVKLRAKSKLAKNSFKALHKKYKAVGA